MKNLIATTLLILSYALIYAQSNPEIKFGLGNARIVKYSPATDLISIAVGNRVKMFRSGIQIASMVAHHSKITAMDFDPEGETITVGHANGKVTIWNAKTRKQQSDFQVSHQRILSCEYIESSGLLAILTRDDLSTWKENGDKIAQSYNHFAHNISMDVAENGQIIVVADSDNRVTFYEPDLEKQGDLITDQKWILSLAIAPDNQSLATGAADGSVHQWSLSDHSFIKPMLQSHGRINSLEFSNNSQYLAAGSEYFYLLSVDAEHPDIVYKKLNGAVLGSSFNPNGKEICIIEDLTPNAEIIDISDLKIPPVFKLRDEGDIIAPQIYVSNPPKITNDRINVTSGMIDLQGSIFDDYGVRALSVNGIETPIKENGKFIIHLPLVMGENPIEIEARDINGNIALKKFIINRKDNDDSYDPLVARNFLFVIGIDDYQYWPQLNNAVKDGSDIAQVLMENYNFRFTDITFLKNEQATMNNIYKGLRSMIEKVTAQDNLLIYFSGHGHFDELLNEGYWIPSDAQVDSPGDYLSNTSILKLIENINTQHTFLVADACFSGSLFADSKRGGYYDKVDRYKSRWGLASGRLEAVSDGAIGTNSPFSLILLNYLRQNDDDEFAVSELIQHVKIHVAEVSDQTPIGNPLRMNGDEGGEFVFRRSYKAKTLQSYSQQQ